MYSIINLLNRYKIDSEKSFKNLGPRLAFFISDLSDILITNDERISSSKLGLSFDLRLNRQTLPLLSSSQLKNMSKKISIYSAKSIIELPDLDISKGSGGKYSIDRITVDKDYRNKKSYQLYKSFISPILSLKEHIETGAINIIPHSYIVDDHHKIKEKIFDVKALDIQKEQERSWDNLSYFSGRSPKFATSGKLISMGFQTIYPKKYDLLNQLTEDVKITNPLNQVYLYLPYINGIDIKTIIKIKEDYTDELIPFYYSTEKLFKNSSKTDSEGKLLDLMGNVDYEVRKLNNLFKKLEKKQSLKSFEVITGLSIMALSLLCDAELSKAIVGSIGGIKAFDGVWHLAHRNDTINEIKQSDFFIPWNINQKNNELG